MWLEGLLVVLSLTNIMYLIVGTVYGIIVGALPGLGPMFAISLLLPLTFGMPMDSAIILMSAVYAACAYGGSYASILVNAPGGVGSVATCWDGHALTQQGKAGFAIGISTFASLMGGIIGWLSLIFTAPLLTEIAMSIRSAEIFAIGILALSLMSMATEGQTLKGLILGAFGLLIAMVGRDPMTATVRQTFGILYLEDGIPLAGIALGIFALSEAISLAERDEDAGEIEEPKGGVLQGAWFVLKKPIVMIRSGLIGAFVGLMPALGISTASIMAYFVEKRAAKNPDDWGKGEPTGLMSPEVANNACVVASLIPTFTLGIPGSPVAALFLTALIVHGLMPGVEFFAHSGSLPYAVFMGILAAQFAFALIGLAMAKYLVKVVRVPRALLVPAITILCVLGAYAIRNTLMDVFFTVIFGFLGYVLKKHNWPLACLALGNVLGAILETNFHRVLMASGGSYAPFFTRPGSLSILLITAILLCWPFIKKLFGQFFSKSLKVT